MKPIKIVQLFFQKIINSYATCKTPKVVFRDLFWVGEIASKIFKKIIHRYEEL